MMKATGAELARIAEETARNPLHGNLDGYLFTIYTGEKDYESI